MAHARTHIQRHARTTTTKAAAAAAAADYVCCAAEVPAAVNRTEAHTHILPHICMFVCA